MSDDDREFVDAANKFREVAYSPAFDVFLDIIRDHYDPEGMLRNIIQADNRTLGEEYCYRDGQLAAVAHILTLREHILERAKDLQSKMDPISPFGEEDEQMDKFQ